MGKEGRGEMRRWGGRRRQVTPTCGLWKARYRRQNDTRTAINNVYVQFVVILLLLVHDPSLLRRVPAVRLRRGRVPLAVDGEVLHEAAERLLLHRTELLIASFARTLELREVLPKGP